MADAFFVVPVSIHTIISCRWLVIATWTVLGKRYFTVLTRRNCWTWPR